MPPYVLYYGRFPQACEDCLHGITAKLPNGKYCVWINTNRNEAIQAHALKHELAHLHFRHFARKECPALEREAEAYADIMTGQELEYLLSYCVKKVIMPDSMIVAFDEKHRHKNPA